MTLKKQKEIYINILDEEGYLVSPVKDSRIYAGERDIPHAESSVTASNNTSGLTLMLDIKGHPYVGFYFNVGGLATLYIEVSDDGVNWRQFYKENIPGAGKEDIYTATIQWRYVRMRVPNTGIDIAFEISAKGV